MGLVLNSVVDCSLAWPAPEDTLWAQWSSPLAMYMWRLGGQVEDIALGLGQEDGASSEQCGRLQPGLACPRGHALGSMVLSTSDVHVEARRTSGGHSPGARTGRWG